MNRSISQNIISSQAADLLISMRDSDAALLFLYFSRRGNCDREKAYKELLLPKQRLNEAYERLEMVGLLPLIGSGAQDDTPVPKDSVLPPPIAKPDLPEYSSDDVRTRAELDSAFSALINEAKLIIGRPLSTPDLIKMLGIYDHFDLPAEVIMELMNFVADVYRDKYGNGRRPSARAFEREAQLWAERGITDFDAAEQYIQRYRKHHSMEGAIKDAMHITDRDFTDTERRYIEQWLTWGFGPDVLAVAYDRTVTNTRKFSPAYMSKILQNWHEKGMHTLPEIEAEHNTRPQHTSSVMGKQSIDADLINALEEQIKEFSHGT